MVREQSFSSFSPSAPPWRRVIFQTTWSLSSVQLLVCVPFVTFSLVFFHVLADDRRSTVVKRPARSSATRSLSERISRVNRVAYRPTPAATCTSPPAVPLRPYV